MNCQKCGFETDKSTCPKCETDILQYALIDKMSYASYNKGLDLAKENDISNAIIELNKAITYDSANIAALNLLGLCYDRIGRVADACKYWIRSCLIADENVAQKYLNVVEESVAEREKLNESIKMYNQAIIYLKQDSLDIAIIQLKNAIDRNHQFVDAYNLLALIYIRQNEGDKAIRLLKKVLDIDIRNDKALRYLESLNYKYVSKSNKHKNPETLVTKAERQTKNSFKDKSVNTKILLAFGFGMVTMLLVYLLLVIPNMRSGFSTSKLAFEKGYKDQIAEQNTLITSKQTELTKLQEENEVLKTENETLKKDYAVLNVYVNLDKAQKFLASKDYTNAAQSILSIDANSVKPEQIDTYNKIKSEVYPLASKALYDSGIIKYDQQKYQEALTDFETSIKFGGTEKVYYPSTLFYIGRCYEGLGNNEQAKVYYQKIINEFPNNDSVYSAKNRLNAISK